MKTLTLSKRKKILADYDVGGVTRHMVAERHCVSVGMVKKLIQQRRSTGDIANRQQFTGRPPIILEKHRQKMADLLAQNPLMKLSELRRKLKLSCTLPAIHRVLKTMGLTYATRCPNPGHRGLDTDRRTRNKPEEVVQVV